MQKARIFNIERFATEDGPGIRTTVFLKGCLLRCKWCANPESQLFERQILFEALRCRDCRRCIEGCPQQAISYQEEYGMITDYRKCVMCKKCVDSCDVAARVVMGEEYTADSLMKILERDEAYYRVSGGGVTFSGGEPFLYASFIKECAEQIHKKGWSVLVETCGQVPIENLRTAVDFVDIIYCDYKHFSAEAHKNHTGKENLDIINNILWLDENFKGEFYLRYPYIPGYNDDPYAIEQFLEFAEARKNVRKVIFLPYHRLGLDKYQGLGMEYEPGNMESVKAEDIQFLKEYEKKYNLEIQIQ